MGDSLMHVAVADVDNGVGSSDLMESVDEMFLPKPFTFSTVIN